LFFNEFCFSLHAKPSDEEEYLLAWDEVSFCACKVEYSSFLVLNSIQIKEEDAVTWIEFERWWGGGAVKSSFLGRPEVSGKSILHQTLIFKTLTLTGFSILARER
jgi:hypothetical protein